MPVIETWDLTDRIASSARLISSLRARVARIPSSPKQRQKVRFGSLADISERIRNVRFTPGSGHAERQQRRPLSAISGHSMQRARTHSGGGNLTPGISIRERRHSRIPGYRRGLSILPSCRISAGRVGHGLRAKRHHLLPRRASMGEIRRSQGVGRGNYGMWPRGWGRRHEDQRSRFY